MTKIPILQGKEVIKALQKIGYKKTRQRGSHVRLQCTGKKSITVPDHVIGRGLLRKILRDVNISPEEFIRML
ncbi:MAG: type II toxin-antitoxin system HicA family toxin [Bacteroidetes bacterium]|nr:type II toxin-antitoxin system HicA family toxin [Bacteroidota bacterium]